MYSGIFMKLKIAFLFIIALMTNQLLRANEPIVCQGESISHVQGVSADDDAIYWSFATDLFKTDHLGKVLFHRKVPHHHGDCCLKDGKLYVSVVQRKGEKTIPEIFVYNSKNLDLLQKISIAADLPKGSDGIVFANGHFYISEGKGSPDVKTPYNRIHQFTSDFKHLKVFKVTGETIYGIQAMTFAHGSFWLGTYGKLHTIQTDSEFNIIARHKLDVAIGVYPISASHEKEPRLMVAKVVKKDKKLQTASLAPVILKDGKLIWE